MNLRATLFAWKNGIAAIEQAGVWQGYGVFEPKRAGEGGLPRLILANDAEVRFASPAETLACLNGRVR